MTCCFNIRNLQKENLTNQFKTVKWWDSRNIKNTYVFFRWNMTFMNLDLRRWIVRNGRSRSHGALLRAWDITKKVIKCGEDKTFHLLFFNLIKREGSGTDYYLYSIVASFSSSCTALPSEAYNFFVFSLSLAFVAIKLAIPVRKSTRSFSNSTLSDMVVSGSYLVKHYDSTIAN